MQFVICFTVLWPTFYEPLVLKTKEFWSHFLCDLHRTPLLACWRVCTLSLSLSLYLSLSSSLLLLFPLTLRLLLPMEIYHVKIVNSCKNIVTHLNECSRAKLSRNEFNSSIINSSKERRLRERKKRKNVEEGKVERRKGTKKKFSQEAYMPRPMHSVWCVCVCALGTHMPRLSYSNPILNRNSQTHTLTHGHRFRYRFFFCHFR